MAEVHSMTAAAPIDCSYLDCPSGHLCSSSNNTNAQVAEAWLSFTAWRQRPHPAASLALELKKLNQYYNQPAQLASAPTGTTQEY